MNWNDDLTTLFLMSVSECLEEAWSALDHVYKWTCCDSFPPQLLQNVDNLTNVYVDFCCFAADTH